MSFGLRVYSHACRTHPASLPLRVPVVGTLPRASFSHGLTTAALPLTTVDSHRLRTAPFICLVHVHAKHTSAGVPPAGFVLASTTPQSRQFRRAGIVVGKPSREKIVDASEVAQMSRRDASAPRAQSLRSRDRPGSSARSTLLPRSSAGSRVHRPSAGPEPHSDGRSPAWAARTLQRGRTPPGADTR